MNRQDDGRYDNRNNDYSGYEGYNRQDDHYHSGKNLTNRFEQEYIRERGHGDQHGNTPIRSYHEGDAGDMYERLSRERGYGNQQGNQFRNSGNYTSNSYQNNPRDYQENARSDRGMYNRDSNRDQDLRGNISQGYGVSGFGGTSDRYNTLNSNQNRSGSQYGAYDSRRSDIRNQNTGSGSSNRSNSFPSSQTYGRNYSDDYGDSLGNTSGFANFGSGTDYSQDNRGRSSGNYGGSGSMDNDSYTGRGSNRRNYSSFRPDHDSNESDRY